MRRGHVGGDAHVDVEAGTALIRERDGMDAVKDEKLMEIYKQTLKEIKPFFKTSQRGWRHLMILGAYKQSRKDMT